MADIKRKSLLIALYHDYHLFGYFKDLIPMLIEHGFKVSVLTCDPQIVQKYSGIDALNISYQRWLNPALRLMDRPWSRAIGWMIGWVWSIFLTARHDLVIVPRDTRPFQHMVTCWGKSLVIRPALGYDDKHYLHHKYGENVEFPDIMQYTKAQAPTVDALCGGSFLKTVRGPLKHKHYTVTGSDIAELFHKLGGPEGHVHVTGNPNYEGLVSAKGQLALENLPENKKIYALFSSQIAFSDDELQKMEAYFDALFEDGGAHLIWKLHPTMQEEYIEALQNWIEKHPYYDIQLNWTLKGDHNNAAIIDMCDGVWVEESNVGLLACFKEKPLFVIALEGTKEAANFFSFYDGVLYCPNSSDFKDHLEQIKDAAFQKKTIDAQNKMLDRICKKTDSPCEEIVKIIENILYGRD